MLAALLPFALAVAAPLRLEDVLAEVEERAPTVEIAAQEVSVASAEVGATGVWQDPMLSFGASGIALPGRPRPPMGTMLSYGVEQTFNTLARRRPAKQAARANVRAVRQRLRRDQWDAKADAVAMFMRVWEIDELEAVYRRQITALDAVREAALSAYRAGLPGGHHDVLRAEAEAAAVRATIASLADERDAAAAMLNTLRGRDPVAAIGDVALPSMDATPSLASLVARRSQSPEVLEARADRQATAAQRRLARGGFAPMITLGGAYEQRLFGMPDSFAAMVSLSVPIWAFDNQKKQVDLATAMVRRAEQRIRSADRIADAEVRMAWSRARAAERRLRVLEDEAIPRMGRTLEASEAAYVSGTGDFLSVLDSTLALQMLEEQRIDATVALHVARFEVERILGGTRGRGRQ